MKADTTPTLVVQSRSVGQPGFSPPVAFRVPGFTDNAFAAHVSTDDTVFIQEWKVSVPSLLRLWQVMPACDLVCPLGSTVLGLTGVGVSPGFEQGLCQWAIRPSLNSRVGRTASADDWVGLFQRLIALCMGAPGVFTHPCCL